MRPVIKFVSAIKKNQIKNFILGLVGVKQPIKNVKKTESKT